LSKLTWAIVVDENAYTESVPGKTGYRLGLNALPSDKKLFKDINPFVFIYYTSDEKSGQDESYLSLSGSEVSSLEYDKKAQKLDIELIDYDAGFLIENETFEVGVPTATKWIRQTNNHADYFEFTPTHIFVGTEMNHDSMKPFKEWLESFMDKHKYNPSTEGFPKTAESNLMKAEIDEVDDEVAIIRNQLGDSVGNIELEDRNVEDVSIEIYNDDGVLLEEIVLGAETFEANGSGYFMETGGRMVSIDSDIEVNYNWDTDPSEIEDDYGEIQEKVEEKVRDEYYQDDSGSGYMREEYLDENNEYQDYEISYEWTKEVSDGAEEEIKSWAETDLSMNAETVSKEMVFNIDIDDAEIENEDELEERGYTQEEIEEIGDALNNDYDKDYVLEDLRDNHLDGLDGDITLAGHSAYLKSRDEMVDDIDASVYYRVDIGDWHDIDTKNAETFGAEGDSWDGTTGDDFRKYDDMELTEEDHEILVEEIERGFENYPADTLRNAKASAVSQINWFGIDKSHGDYDAETTPSLFDAKAKWAGFCPFCKKWRTDEMSKEMKGEIVCGKKIASPNSYGGDMEAFNRENFERKGGKWLRSNSICSVVLEEKPTYYNAEEFDAEHYMKYFDELENLYGRQNHFTYDNLGSMAYKSLYMAARELGATPIEAFNLCNSKWIRRNEDYIPDNMTEMFMNMMYRQGDNWKHYIEGDGDYQIEDYSRNTLWRGMKSRAEITMQINEGMREAGIEGYDAENEVFNASMYKCPECSYAGYQEEFLEPVDFSGLRKNAEYQKTDDERILAIHNGKGKRVGTVAIEDLRNNNDKVFISIDGYNEEDHHGWHPQIWDGVIPDSQFMAETFNANAKSGDKVYVITRRCEDYSAYRELDMAVFGSKTEAKKKFNMLFKRIKNDDDELRDMTIAEAKGYMWWGEYWGIESFRSQDLIYELRECIVGEQGDFYFDAESESDIDLESYEKPYNDKDFYDGDYFCDICGSNRNADNDVPYEEKKPASYLKRGVVNACSGCLRDTKGSKDIQPLIDKIKGDSQ
jgi:hypothetical protein